MNPENDNLYAKLRLKELLDEMKNAELEVKNTAAAYANARNELEAEKQRIVNHVAEHFKFGILQGQEDAFIPFVRTLLGLKEE
mgnify:CR=1 FL=1